MPFQFCFMYICAVERKAVILLTPISVVSQKMTVQKTKAKLVDVARQLFAKRGVEETTMNEIATACGKGRRTLYTYFKNKEEIYLAVVKAELDMLSEKMEHVAERPVPPHEKIMELIMTHLDAIKMVVYRNGTLRAGFFRNIWKVEWARKSFDRKKIMIFRKVLQDGKENGYFDVDNVEITADIVHYCLKGVEVPYIRGKIGEALDNGIGWHYVSKLVFGALGCVKRDFMV